MQDGADFRDVLTQSRVFQYIGSQPEVPPLCMDAELEAFSGIYEQEISADSYHRLSAQPNNGKLVFINRHLKRILSPRVAHL
jgi:hypothetical protein